MPALTEKGEWLINGDTLKMKFENNKATSADLIAYEDRNGGSKDIIKPIPVDGSRVILWNNRVSGNKLLLSINKSCSCTNELVRE